jgi:hypothetical protein
MRNEKCPICGNDIIIDKKSDNFVCSNNDCEISQGWHEYLKKIFNPIMVINENSFDWGTLFN